MEPWPGTTGCSCRVGSCTYSYWIACAALVSLMTLILSLVAVVAGAWIGLKFPDVDQRTDLLLHRSIITHGRFSL